MYRQRRGGFGSFRGGGPTAPVKVGEELDVTIEAVGEKGDGIAKKDGFVLFIPGVKEGEQVHIRVTKVLRKVGFAEVVGKAEKKPEAEKPEYAKEEVAEVSEEAAEVTEAKPVAEDTETFGEEETKPEYAKKEEVEEGSVEEEAGESEE